MIALNNYGQSMAFILFYVLLISLSTGFWGTLISYPFQKKMFPLGNIASIMGGMFFLMGIGYWLAYEKLFSIWEPLFHIYLFWAGFIGACVIFLNACLKKERNFLKKSLYNILILFTICFAITFFYLLFSTDGSVFLPSIGNNDVFSWGIGANIIRGVIPIENLPGQEQYIKHCVLDAFGTNLYIGYIASIINKDTLQACFFINILLMVWSSQALYLCIQKLFNFKFNFSWLIVILVISSPVMIYIFISYFEGMIISYFCLYMMIFSTINTHQVINKNLLFSLGTLFLAYQAGFIVNVCAAVGLSSFHIFFTSPKEKRIIYIFKFLILPYCIAFIGLSIIFYPVLMHTIERSILVLNIKAGWCLPLLNIFTLSSIPTFTSITDGGTLLEYILFFLCYLILMAFLIKQRRKALISISLFYIICIIVYITYYYSIEWNYQAWKFAMMTVSPLSFILYGTIIECIQSYFIAKKQMAVLGYILIVSLCFFHFYDNKKMVAVDSYTYFKNLDHIEPLIPYGTPLAINAAVSETMMAILKFSPHYPIYPLSLSYLSVWDNNQLPSGTKFLVNNPFAKSETILIKDSLQFFITPQNFSEPESLGTWTDGPEATLVCTSLLPNKFLLNLTIKSIFYKNSKYPFIISVKNENGDIIKRSITFTQPGIYSVAFEGVVGSHNINIHIPVPTSPNSINPNSPDNRLLGLFISEANITPLS